MDLLKETTIETIKRMPDGCTIEDIMYKPDFISQALAGVKDAESGKMMTTEEILNKVAQKDSTFAVKKIAENH